MAKDNYTQADNYIMKKLLLVLCLILISGCYYTNTKLLNFPASLNTLRNNTKIDLNEVISTKTVYKLKNGMLVDKYRKHYGYWYRVRRGDCLSRIAGRAGARVRTLARVNNLRINSVLKYKSYMFIPVSEVYLKRNAEQITFNLKRSDFMWPLYGRMTSGFGLRKWGWRKKFHKGIDIAAPPGTKVVSARDGEVTFAGRKRSYGYIVIIKHKNNFETRYAHLARTTVRRGDKIGQGEVIGMVGKTGRSTGYHLHFEIRINDYAVNPTGYLPKEVNKLAKMYNTETTGKKH